MSEPRQLPERLHREIASLREMMWTVHYFSEASWLVAAVDFPGLCGSAVAQESLRSAATIAWRLGFPAVTTWLNREILTTIQPAVTTAETAWSEPLLLKTRPT